MIRTTTFRAAAAFGLALLMTASGVSLRPPLAAGAAAKDRSDAAAKARSGPAATPAARGQVFTVDNAHSFVEFSVRLLGFNRVRGSFPRYSAHVYFDSAAVERSAVSLRMSVEGVDTHDSERDQHLESADFFDTARFPVIRFDSRSVRRAGAGLVVAGDLTIRDVTRAVEIPLLITTPVGPDPFGNPRFSTVGRVVINRRDFGVIGPDFWNRSISDSVEIEFELGCRRWNFDALGWGNPKRTSIGARILETDGKRGLKAALDESRDLFAKQRGQPDWNFGLFEYVKCAGRLGQRGRAADGARVLAQAIELRADSTEAADLTVLRCYRTELLLQADEGAAAREEWLRAQAGDSTSTFVRALSRAIER